MVDMSYFYCVLSQFDIASELWLCREIVKLLRGLRENIVRFNTIFNIHTLFTNMHFIKYEWWEEILKRMRWKKYIVHNVIFI